MKRTEPPEIQSPTNSKKGGGVRHTRRQQADFLKGCTLDERSYCVRLVRLLRDDYWISELLRQILDQESSSPYCWTLTELKALLDNFDTIEALVKNAKRLGHNWSNHPILRAIREEWGEIEDYKNERSIRELVESARRGQIK